ncbi:hypothetical protein [Glycomyces xiaoerkulensis]|uniref:hypothetical protein n=1 Tax=Glycomyces xiaoerkulensis TaxID=2038139 RepID=UPI000C258AA7|nr:hypothetical protein [Glycomyces xiaoerkulensis]
MSDDPYWNTEDPSGSSSRFGGDPLVTDGFEAWWTASLRTVGRSWRTMGLILLVGVVLPRWVYGTYRTFTGPELDLDGLAWGEVGGMWWPGLPAAVVGGLLGLVLLYLMGAAGLAATRTAAAEAAGGFLSVGEAFAFGLRRGWRFWPWLILAWLTVAVGLVLCVLPGLWALFALSLMVPAATFEHRRSPYARSVRLTHSAFWPALGRMIIVVLVLLVANVLIAMLGAVLTAVWPAVFSGWAASVLIVITEAVMSLLLLVPMVWVLAAALCAYAWLRGRRESVSATSLSAEASG